MTSPSQLLPSLLLLIFGGVGLLWLSEPPRVGAAGPQPVAERAAPTLSRAPGNLPPAERVPAASQAIRWPKTPRAEPTPGGAAPAQAFGPAEMALLRQRVEEQKAQRRREVLRQRARAEDAWFSERAGQLARELELPEGSAELLTGLSIQERDRRTAAWERVRACPSRDESRQMLRDEMRAILEWRQEELVRLLGPVNAERVIAAENAALIAED